MKYRISIKNRNYKKDQVEILELKTTINGMKYLLKRLNSRFEVNLTLGQLRLSSLRNRKK
jgi:hypothetical protein